MNGICARVQARMYKVLAIVERMRNGTIIILLKSHHSNVLCPPAMYCVSTETGAMLVTNKIAVFRMDIDSKYCSQYFTYKNVIIIKNIVQSEMTICCPIQLHTI